MFHPYHWHDIWVELGQPAATGCEHGDLTSQAMRDYYVGSLLGIQQIYTSSNVTDLGGMTRFWRVYAKRLRWTPPGLPAGTGRDASLRAWELNATAGGAYGLGPRPTFGVGFTADAAEPS